MYRYIYRRHGHKDESMTQKSAATFLVAEGCPQWAANIIIQQAESRCRMKKQLAEYAGSQTECFEATITAELHVELWPDPAESAQPAQARMF